MGSISFGDAFVAGKNLVPRPAAGNTAFLTLLIIHRSFVMQKLDSKGLKLKLFYHVVGVIERGRIALLREKGNDQVELL
jgi:hypothetical protein